MDLPEILESELDQSVNFVWHESDGLIEARYVRRRTDRCIIYLSVKTGCGLRCRMCHLTQSGQARAVNVGPSEVLNQAQTVLDWVQLHTMLGRIEPVTGVDFSFMARGDFFDNRLLIKAADELLDGLYAIAAEAGLDARVKLSTILPQTMRDEELSDVFRSRTPDIYYSVYSADPGFRQQWLPRALPVEVGLHKLVSWQEASRKLVILHGAFMAGENDDPATIARLGELVAASGLRVDWNVVRYNPYSPEHGKETPDIDACVARLERAFPHSRITVVSRVGPDVQASCGMFVSA